jgi:hypothetical protein
VDLVIFKMMDYIRVEIELKMFYYIHLPEETYNISKKNNDKENEEMKKKYVVKTPPLEHMNFIRMI